MFLQWSLQLKECLGVLVDWDRHICVTSINQSINQSIHQSIKNFFHVSNSCLFEGETSGKRCFPSESTSFPQLCSGNLSLLVLLTERFSLL